MGMALDEPQNSDIVVESDGIKFVIEKGLAAHVPSVNIGFRSGLFGSGFMVAPGSSRGCSEGCC